MPSSRNKPPSAPPPTDLRTPPPPSLSSLKFKGPPVRRILSPEDQKIFNTSPTHDLILNFILDLNSSVYNRRNSSLEEPLPVFVQELSKIIDGVRELVDLHPPVDNGKSRFGNKAFRGFYDAVWEKAGELHWRLGLPEEVLEEVKRYFCESWGNRTRIDYGSGHELNFLAWILCFYQLNLLRPSDYPAVVLHLFLKYIHLMRFVQTTYYLEPAGSHGVWGLDDYQFLPFLFGSAQLYSHPHLRPKSIHNEDLLHEFHEEYIYFSCIQFINSIKTTAGLRWHSPMLDDISGALNWGKVNSGMIKMYDKEVLGKLPIMQHFMFGALIPAPEGIAAEDDAEGLVDEDVVAGRAVIDRDGMRHVHSTWGECCGIKVPSAIGAREQIAKQTLRKVPRIPFD